MFCTDQKAKNMWIYHKEYVDFNKEYVDKYMSKSGFFTTFSTLNVLNVKTFYYIIYIWHYVLLSEKSSS